MTITTHKIRATTVTVVAIACIASHYRISDYREDALRRSRKEFGPTVLEMLDPGLVQVHRWRPGSVAPDDGEQIPGYAGLARKAG